MNLETRVHTKDRFSSYEDFLSSWNNGEVNSQRALEIFESKHNILKRSVFPENFDKSFMPYYGDGIISLPYINTDRHTDDIQVVGDSPTLNLPMIFHPHFSIEERIDDIDGHIPAVISSSTRTLFLQDQFEGMCVKTHLPIHIGPFRRGLSPSSVQYSVAINDYLFTLKNSLAQGVYFLPEFYGCIYKNTAGCLYRSIQPIGSSFELSMDDHALIPLFSLYTPFERGSSILLSLVGGVNNVLENIVEPFIYNWFWMIRNTGIILEPHGQNALLIVDRLGRTKGFAYRDFQALRVIDFPHLPSEFRYRLSKHLLIDEEKIKASLSLVYDTYISDFVFRNFAPIWASSSKTDISVFEDAVKNIFSKYCGEFGGLFHSEKVRPAQKDKFTIRFEGDAILEKCGKPQYR